MSFMKWMYPSSCILCGEPKTEAYGMCSVCWEKMQKIGKGRRVRHRHSIGAELCAAKYRDELKTAIIMLKFYGKRENIAPIAQIMREAWEAHGLAKPDCITYVPLSPLQQYRRGFNQSEELARIIAEEWELPFIPTLRRSIFSRRQSTLNTEQRRINAKRSFHARKACDLTGKRVLLIDDIVTTGATVNACASQLHSIGAEHIWVLAAAKT